MSAEAAIDNRQEFDASLDYLYGKPLPHSPERAARHRDRGPSRRPGAGGRGAGGHARRGQPAPAPGRGAAGDRAVQADRTGPEADGGAAPGDAAADGRLQRAGRWHCRPQGRRRACADADRGQRLRLALADLAHRQVQPPASGHRGAARGHRHDDRPCSFRHRCRHPLRTRQLAGRALRAGRRIALQSRGRPSPGPAPADPGRSPAPAADPRHGLDAAVGTVVRRGRDRPDPARRSAL